MPLDSFLNPFRDDPEVQVEQGTVRGYYSTDINGKTFIKFKGIPYAKPPLGELRFKAPQPPEKWTEVFQAAEEGHSCYAADPFKNDKVSGHEHCLYLNVYTRKLPSKKHTDLKPVLFWIHGGGFTFGSSSEYYYGPHFLMSQDVVVVTINYRLGLLGFVSFTDPSLDIPGNAGFKDQVMALKWVQKNIKGFSGNPDNVTIFGESAGAASVHLLMLSPMARGLFHKAIAQSGCAINPWVSCKAGCENLAKALGLEGEDDRTVYEALRKKTRRELLVVQKKMDLGTPPNKRRGLGFVAEINSRDPFLDREPMEVLLSGKYKPVPLIIGYNITEGMFIEMFGKIRSLNFEDYIPWNFGYESGSSESKEVASKIENFYRESVQTPEDEEQMIYNLVTDSQILHGIHLTIINSHHHTPVFFYRMTVESRLNFFKMLKRITKPGVSHFDDIGYLFRTRYTPKLKPSLPEYTLMMRFVKLWTNFAKFVTPTPEEKDELLNCVWKVVQGPDLSFLDIGWELTAGINPDVRRMQFWKMLYDESPSGRDAAERYGDPREIGVAAGLGSRPEIGEGSGLKFEQPTDQEDSSSS